jgi:hypothetical protein
MTSKSERMEEAQQWRRDKVLEYTSQGYSQREIASKLQVAPSTIAYDQIYLRNKAKENIKSYVDERLPEEYEKCLVGINAINKQAWDIAHNAEDNREKIQALSLAKECYSMKLDLLTNAELVNDAVKFVEKHKQQDRDNNNTKNSASTATTTTTTTTTASNDNIESEEEQQPHTTNEVF